MQPLPGRSSMLTDIRKPLGIVDQVRIALSRRYLLATLIGALLGAIVPLATFAIVHTEIDPALSWYEQPEILIVAGGLIYSARTVYQWGRMAFASGAKALGFTMLIEGVMTLSSQPWLSGLALVYLCGINAIATGTTLARGAAADDADVTEPPPGPLLAPPARAYLPLTKTIRRAGKVGVQ
jgi:hypothetical protein